MNLWDVAAMCLLLLSSVATRPLYQSIHPAKRTLFPASYSDSAHQSAEDQGANLSMRSAESNLQEISMEDQCKLYDRRLRHAYVIRRQLQSSLLASQRKDNIGAASVN